MNKILSKAYFSEKVVKLEVEAPLIAKSRKPGNFVIVRVGEKGERMPLTIADANLERGSITLVVQVMGVSSRKLCALEVGDYITDLVGPLGKPTHIEKVGTVLACGGGVGVAPLLPIVRAFKEAGNRVVSVIAGRNKDLVILEDEIRASSDEVIIMTDDGSYGHKGFVTELLKDRLEKDKKVQEVVAVGPVPMMQAVAGTTLPFGVATTVSLNSLMVDGIGMCGACRVTVDGETKFTCVDGPEFDGHKVDFAELRQRLSAFRSQEKQSIEHHEHRCSCHDKH